MDCVENGAGAMSGPTLPSVVAKRVHIRPDRVPRNKTWRKTRHQRLPWLRCRHCGAHLARIDVSPGGRPQVRLDGPARLAEGVLVCPRCGHPRQFLQNLNVSG